MGLPSYDRLVRSTLLHGLGEIRTDTKAHRYAEFAEHGPKFQALRILLYLAAVVIHNKPTPAHSDKIGKLSVGMRKR